MRALLNPWVILGLVAALGAAYLVGRTHEANAVAAQQLEDERAAWRAYGAAMTRNRELTTALAEERQRDRIVYRTIREEVPRVVTQFIPAPGADAESLPSCVFTRGYLRLWNDALAGHLSTTAGGAPGAAAGSDSTERELEPADIDQQDVIENHIDNAEICTGVRKDLGKLQQWHRDNQGAGDGRE